VIRSGNKLQRYKIPQSGLVQVVVSKAREHTVLGYAPQRKLFERRSRELAASEEVAEILHEMQHYTWIAELRGRAKSLRQCTWDWQNATKRPLCCVSPPDPCVLDTYNGVYGLGKKSLHQAGDHQHPFQLVL